MALAPQKSRLDSVATGIVLACLLFFLRGASGQGVEAEVWHSSGDWASGVDYGFYDSEGAFDAEGGGVAAEAVDDYAVIANADTLITRLAGQDTSDKVIPTVIVGIGEPMDDDIVFENEEASSLPQQPTTLATTRSVERATPPPAPLTPVITCQELYCYGGGTCVFNGREGATCHCPLGRQGYQCQEEVEVRYPRFQGESFLSFPQLVASNMRFRVSLEFKAESLDGLLMFSGKYRDGRGDFFSIALVNGHVQFRFNCGTGPANITTNSTVQLGKWHKLTVYRNRWNGWVSLDNKDTVHGRAKGLYHGITFRLPLYLGGVPDLGLVQEHTGVAEGFKGCVQKLIVNKERYNMRPQPYGKAVSGINVGECSEGVCEYVYCRNGGKCVAGSADSHLCLCPLGFTGTSCERDLDLSIPFFNSSRSAYSAYPTLGTKFLSFIEIEVVFRPQARNGVLLYTALRTDGSGDFLSLVLDHGFLEFRFDCGTGPAIIRSAEPVTMGEWHRVILSRTARDGVMTVDYNPPVSGTAEGGFSQISFITPLYIGGVADYEEVAKYSGVYEPFHGDIQKIIINDSPMDLISSAIVGVNVANADHPCVGDPCVNGGLCVPDHDFYSCNCPLGYHGMDCEKELKSPVTVPKFSGNSYMQYTGTQLMKRLSGNRNDFQIRIKTTTADGMILWSGSLPMGRHRDFISIGLEGGAVVLRYNLGSGEAQLSSNSTINDGRWHKIRARRDGPNAVLILDDLDPVPGTSPGRLKQLNTNSGLFLGGMNNIVMDTGRHYTRGIVGCISHVTLATDYHIRLYEEATAGQNIVECS
ncbi:pikachurin-like isoform X2 [Branchiostoma floridae x Branchiostoma belcheri]